MKRYIILSIVSIMSVFTFSLAASELQQASSQQSANPNWIEVGTVIGDAWDSGTWYSNGPRELKLYVMYLGEKLIYRVEWDSHFYPVTPNKNNSSSTNAVAKIKKWGYKKVQNSDGSSYIKFMDMYVHFNVPSW